MTNRIPTPPDAPDGDSSALIRIRTSTSRWRSTAGGSVSAIHAFVVDSGGYQALITWAETHGRIDAFGIRRHRQLWRRPGTCGAPRGASGCRSESGRPAHATCRRQVRHPRRGGRRAVRTGGAVDGHPEDRGRCRRDDAPAEDHAGHRSEGAHHGDEHAEADRRARPAGTARSPPRPHRSRPAHALRRTPTGPHRHAHRVRQVHPPGPRPPLDGSHRGNGDTRPAPRAPHDRNITDPP